MSSSRPWKVTVREPVREVAVAEDEVKTTLEILPVLPPERTAPILARVLKEHGFEEDGGALVRDGGGVRVEVDPGTGGVRISAEESADLPPPPEPRGGCPCAARLPQKAREAAADDVRKGLQSRVTGRLEKALPALGCELETVAQQVTGKALVEKAKELGELKKIVHEESGAITIVVEV